MQIQLRWVDPTTGIEASPTLYTPIAFGCTFGAMPASLDGQRVSRMVLNNTQVEPYHALLEDRHGQLRINDQGSRLGTQVNGIALPSQAVPDGAVITMGPFEIVVDLTAGSVQSDPGTCDRKVGFLFKRRCGRTTTAGCPDCQNGRLPPDHDLYQDDYSLYPGFGNYGRNYWGYHYYTNADRYYYDPNSRRVDFTEADAASFEEESDQDYEMTLDAS